MEIRKMTIEDYDTMYRMWTSTDGMGIRSLDDSREGIEKFLNKNPNTNFVATVDGEIIGVTLAGNDGRRGHIYHTAVSTSHRGQKVGRDLLTRVYEAMEAEGINKMGLLVYRNNDSGNAFWQAQDWTNRTDLYYYDKTLNFENK